MRQLALSLETPKPAHPQAAYLERLIGLLRGDLDFHAQSSSHGSHNFHSFPAKFPPQLPRLFIDQLTAPGELVLDPMMGSATTVVEAVAAGRRGVGFDIDPLAVLMARAKVTPTDAEAVAQQGADVVRRARQSVGRCAGDLDRELVRRWDRKTKEFVDYLFLAATQRELLALVEQIEQVRDPAVKAFLLLAFSAIIITKSGGVSLALDLAHTRPHRAKVIRDGGVVVVLDPSGLPHENRREGISTKGVRSPLEEFDKRFRKNLRALPRIGSYEMPAYVGFGNAQGLPLGPDSVDLIVTSPPYASNAIDYMRAHKFSLVWMGHSIVRTGKLRSTYIGGDATASARFESLPPYVEVLVNDVSARDAKKGLVLRRYYSEMTRVLREMHRVLRPGKAAIVVVGASVMRGRDTETAPCMERIARGVGPEAPATGVRRLDRDRRMMPAGRQVDLGSQIQQRMHEEFIIGLRKPQSTCLEREDLPGPGLWRRKPVRRGCRRAPAVDTRDGSPPPSPPAPASERWSLQEFSCRG